MTVEYQRVALEEVGENSRSFLGVFCADDDMVDSRDSNWLQHSMNVLIGLIQRYGLTDNINKSCTMIFQTCALRSGI